MIGLLFVRVSGPHFKRKAGSSRLGFKYLRAVLVCSHPLPSHPLRLLFEDVQAKLMEAKKAVAKLAKMASALPPAKFETFSKELEKMEEELTCVCVLDGAILQASSTEDLLSKFKEVHSAGWVLPSAYLTQLMMTYCESMLKYQQWKQMEETLVSNPFDLDPVEMQNVTCVTIESVFCKLIKNVTRADAKHDGPMVRSIQARSCF